MNILSKFIVSFVIILIVFMTISIISDARITRSFLVGAFFSFAVFWPIFVNFFLSILSSKADLVSWMSLGGSTFFYAFRSISNIFSMYNTKKLDPQISVGLLFISIDFLPYFICLWIAYLYYWRCVISR